MNFSKLCRSEDLNSVARVRDGARAASSGAPQSSNANKRPGINDAREY